ncbi:cobalamin-dependent protein [Micromonospora sp. WMMA1949]|uniref:cobalamin-dependent protein n=1 Tax=unclassified Micromonospora TaxID=2617518 RepID=UPI0022B6C436|nr:cobalamin-dependent protein [Micromonospora sp. WMMA1949]MCZ7428601.1 cobalamin-dependent protein [Micromonospora sp. WMMA1949]
MRLYDAPVTADRQQILADLVEQSSDVYGFSCYVWNMGLVRWLVDELAERRPGTRFLLGGPQVMGHAQRYVPPSRPDVAVCNGEGERTFRAYLRALLNDERDLSGVPGISFWRDGELVTTDRPERIKELSEIPSPYLGGVFEPGRYTYAILETNRGCPYNCGFCFWGAATNSKVNRFETQRVLDDITWISDNELSVLYIADANWGIFPRDVEITRHVVACRERTGYPLMMGMSAAKNKPDRVSDITRLLVDGGMLTSQPVSLQSMDSGVLKLIERDNIRPATYTTLQETLRGQNISSYTEVIWPLPGETVESFRKGIAELCRARSGTIVVYPQLLLHNTPIYENRERFGITVRRVPDPAAEADVVVATKWVTEEQYREGVAFYYAVHGLYSLRGLYYLANYLDRTGAMSFDELFAAAARYLAGHREDSPIGRFVADSVRDLGNYYLLNSGTYLHMLLHGERAEYTRLLAGFVRTQPFWSDPDARALFELDLLARPFVYREKPSLPDYAFTELRVAPRPDGSMEVTAPPAAVAILADLDSVPLSGNGPLLLRHPYRRKMPFHANQPLQDNIAYCDGMTIQIRSILPEWTAVPATIGG